MRWRNVKYYYDNLLFISLDSSLKQQWNNVILKNQTDDDNDNFMPAPVIASKPEGRMDKNRKKKNRSKLAYIDQRELQRRISDREHKPGLRQ